MKIFFKVFGQATMAVFSRTATWIIMAGCILMNATFIMIVPLSLNDMPA
jgi:hypothetical protein